MNIATEKQGWSSVGSVLRSPQLIVVLLGILVTMSAANALVTAVIAFDQSGDSVGNASLYALSNNDGSPAFWTTLLVAIASIVALVGYIARQSKVTAVAGIAAVFAALNVIVGADGSGLPTRTLLSSQWIDTLLVYVLTALVAVWWAQPDQYELSPKEWRVHVIASLVVLAVSFGLAMTFVHSGGGSNIAIGRVLFSIEGASWVLYVAPVAALVLVFRYPLFAAATGVVAVGDGVAKVVQYFAYIPLNSLRSLDAILGLIVVCLAAVTLPLALLLVGCTLGARDLAVADVSEGDVDGDDPDTGSSLDE